MDFVSHTHIHDLYTQLKILTVPISIKNRYFRKKNYNGN